MKKSRLKIRQTTQVLHRLCLFFLAVDLKLAGFFLAPKGNALGNKIESGLSPVGKPVGKGLETISRPVGGLVEPLVGGLLRSGGAYGNNAGVGAGNMEHKKAEEKREQEREKEERHAPVGGQEQTGQNPLGLSNP